MLHLFGFRQQGFGTRVDFRLALLPGVVQHEIPDALDAVEKIGVKRGKFGAVAHAGGFQPARCQDRDKNADGQIPQQCDPGQRPAGDSPHKAEHAGGHKNRNADGGDGVGIEHLQRFNVRGDHGDDGALLLAFQLGRAECAQRAENLVPQHRQQPKRNVVVAVLLKKAQDTAQNAAADGKGDDGTVGQGDTFAQRFGNAHRAEQRYAHGTEKAERAVDDCQDHNVGKAAQKQKQVRHDHGAASAQLRILFHFSTSA